MWPYQPTSSQEEAQVNNSLHLLWVFYIYIYTRDISSCACMCVSNVFSWGINKKSNRNLLKTLRKKKSCVYGLGWSILWCLILMMVVDDIWYCHFSSWHHDFKHCNLTAKQAHALYRARRNNITPRSRMLAVLCERVSCNAFTGNRLLAAKIWKLRFQ